MNVPDIKTMLKFQPSDTLVLNLEDITPEWLTGKGASIFSLVEPLQYKRIKFYRCTIRIGVLISAGFNYFSRFPRLVAIEVDNCVVSEEALIELLDIDKTSIILHGRRRLTEIIINRYETTVAFIDTLFAYAKANHKLTTLGLVSMYMPIHERQQWVDNLLKHITSCEHRIQTLSLSFSSIPDDVVYWEQYRTLMPLFHNMHCLTSLHLGSFSTRYKSDENDVVFNHFWQKYIPTAKTLRHLQFSKGFYIQQQKRVILDALATNTSLLTLDMSKLYPNEEWGGKTVTVCVMDCDGDETLASAIERVFTCNKTLIRISFGHCAFSQIREFARVMEIMRRYRAMTTFTLTFDHVYRLRPTVEEDDDSDSDDSSDSDIDDHVALEFTSDDPDYDIYTHAVNAFTTYRHLPPQDSIKNRIILMQNKTQGEIYHLTINADNYHYETEDLHLINAPSDHDVIPFGLISSFKHLKKLSIFNTGLMS